VHDYHTGVEGSFRALVAGLGVARARGLQVVATTVGGLRYPMTVQNRRSLLGLKPEDKGAVSTSIKEGGDQLEYEDQDPRIQQMWVEATTKKKDDSEASPGALYSSGLIAAGGVFGLLGIIIALLQDPEISNRVPHWLTATLGLPWRADFFAFGPKTMGPLATSNLFGIFMFALLAASLFYFARKKLN